MLSFIAISPSAKIALVLMCGIVVFSLVDWYLGWRVKHRHRTMQRLFREARESHANVLSGLRKMAEIYTDLPEHPIELSRQGVRLLDTQARAADTFDKLCRKYGTMSRERRMRQLTRALSKLHGQEAVFGAFQDGVLRAVSDQARSGIVAPPVPGRSYRAVFTVLDHDLPERCWPAMEEILAGGVTLKMQDVDGRWHSVPLKFTGGGKAEFSRKHLERAVALKMIIERAGGAHEVFEYAVKHGLPMKPGRGATRHLAALRRMRTIRFPV